MGIRSRHRHTCTDLGNDREGQRAVATKSVLVSVPPCVKIVACWSRIGVILLTIQAWERPEEADGRTFFPFVVTRNNDTSNATLPQR